VIADHFDNIPPANGNGNGKHNPEMMSTIRAASDLIARSQLAARAGLSFGGDRDLYSVLGYSRSISVPEYRERFRRGGIAGRVVDAFPNATWRGGIEIVEDEDPEISTDFEEQWNLLNKKHRIWSKLNRVDILAGLGRYALLLIGAPGDLQGPLEKINGPEGVLYFSMFAEDEADIETVVLDTTNPRYGLPETYRLKRRGTNDKLNLDKIVHWSRVVHVADGLLDDELYGTPRLERIWNHLDDLDKVTGGGSEAFWLRVHQGMVFNIDPGIKIEPSEIAKLEERAEEFAHQMRRTLAARGFKVESLGSDVSNFGNQVASLISLISGATGIPQRILLGSERGELSSTQDRENWNDRITDRRTSFAEPIVRTLIERLMSVGAMEEVEEYTVRWPELADLTEEQQANIATKWSDLNKKAGGTVVTPEEIRDHVLGLEPLKESQKEPETETDPTEVVVE